MPCARHLVLALALLPQLVAAAPGSADRVDVLLVASRTPSGEPTADDSTAGVALSPGEEGTTYLFTDSSLCVRKVGSMLPRSAQKWAGPGILWTVDARVVSIAMPTIVLDIDWSRERVDADGSLRPLAGDRRTVTFKEEERQTLDFLLSETSGSPCGLSLRVDVAASIHEDPKLAGAVIRYDGWLIDQPPAGKPMVHRLQTSAKQGERISLPFDSLRWDIPGVRFKDGRGAQVAVTVTGQARGRIRGNGTIDIALEASRWIGIVKDGDANRGGTDDGGSKTFTIAPGETVALVLPAVQGGGHTMSLDEERMSSTSAPSPSQNPVTVTPDSVTLTNQAFFAGHTMSLRLTATRVEAQESR